MILSVLILASVCLLASIAYCECECLPQVIQHAMRMRHSILLSAACPALPYFSTLSYKRHDFGGKKMLNTRCVF
jgi:hypothetical protein